MKQPRFHAALLAWFERHGRRNLPWQRGTNPDPYRVWVSEIMLQQTQVSTVIGYFERFVARFPAVTELATAQIDEVLHLWSGLGYYARARNLHRAAQILVADYDGKFPDNVAALESLPGIGRSTAGAILSLGLGKRHPILDGNVKRVLCRYHAIEQWPGESAITKALWRLAEHHTPEKRFAEYTQAIMDLGATVCVRSRPVCEACPLKRDCLAYASHRQHLLPTRRPKRDRPKRLTKFLIVRDAAGRFLLERRPPAGIWGGLWGFPECDPTADPTAWCSERLGLEVCSLKPLATVHHGFTHFDLDIEPVLLEVEPAAGAARGVMAPEASLWYNARSPERVVGLAAPVSALLEQLQDVADND